MDTFVARQPIFNTREKRHAYELLFRSGPENFFPAATDGDQASSQVIHDSLHTFGIDKLAGGKMVFINITRRLLLQEVYATLPPKRFVLELLETIEPDAEVLAACTAATKAGYFLALDDFVFDPKYEKLLRLASIVKIDFLQTQGEERRRVAERLLPVGVELLAEKVETREDFKEAVELGYHYFQGYFFAKPEMLVGQAIPQFKVNHLHLLAALHKGEVDMDELVQIVRKDPAMSVKLLRYLNSAFFGWKSRIVSLRHAVALLGETGFRRWAALVTLAGMGADRPDELLVASLVRAKFCELVSDKARLSDKNVDFFLIGLLASVDAFCGGTLAEVLAQLALSGEMNTALLRVTSPIFDAASHTQEEPATRVLALAFSYERANWDGIDTQTAALGLTPMTVPALYNQAVTWAQDTLTGT